MEKLTSIETTNKVRLQKANLTACVISLEDFKSAYPSISPYGQCNLKKAYRSLSGETAIPNINFFLEDGNVYLIPESGAGLTQDLENMRLARSIL